MSRIKQWYGRNVAGETGSVFGAPSLSTQIRRANRMNRVAAKTVMGQRTENHSNRQVSRSVDPLDASITKMAQGLMANQLARRKPPTWSDGGRIE